MARYNHLQFLFKLFLLFNILIVASSKNSKQKVNKIGKNVGDYNDVDVEKLLDQWNENDEDDEDEDTDDPRLKPRPKINMEEIFKAGGSQEEILKASKKGQPLMIFANVAGNPSRKETETVSALWQTSLRNNQIQVQRYVISDNRVLFQLEDGSQAFEIKDYLTSLNTCESVSFENLNFPGKGAGKTKLEL
ncbi:LDLR chaperone boca isoform X1 [Hydra vulgaris]|uniref:LDLR chaperone MESD n=1 Tax=Hydra vulgaris TaxID=6087 RepID=T2MDA1_HYDVU|nr:LDLR chaperone boca isoform X1 [Hydra vulgaris]XP_012564309.1 LDLR chaperone boca isoform X1 [Hydra vulgaris]